MAKRRANGNGSISYNEKTGLWCARVSVGYNEKGKPVRKAFYGKSHVEAHDKLIKALSGKKQGLNINTNDRLTLVAFLTDWLENNKKPSIKPKTYRIYEQQLRTHIIPAFRGTLLTKLTAPQVQKFLNSKLAEGLAPATVKSMYMILHGALERAYKWDYVPRNVANMVDPPTSKRYKATTLDPNGALKLLEVVKGDRNEALYAVALFLGPRQGEALALKWEDVDFERKLLHIRASVAKIKGEWIFGPPKSESSRRTLPLTDAMIAVLRAHKARQLEEQLKVFNLWQDYGLVFPSEKGTPMDARNLVRHFHRMLRLAGLPPMRWHDLRHTTATLLISHGVNGRYVMEILGHSQISLTMNTYADVLPSVTRDAIEGLSNVLSGAV
jgi:integrase